MVRMSEMLPDDIALLIDDHLALLQAADSTVQAAVLRFLSMDPAAQADQEATARVVEQELTRCRLLALPDVLIAHVLSFCGDALELGALRRLCRVACDRHIPAAATWLLGCACADPLARLQRQFCRGAAEAGVEALRLNRPWAPDGVHEEGEPFSAFTRAACPGPLRALPGAYVFVVEFRLRGPDEESALLRVFGPTPEIELSEAERCRLRDALPCREPDAADREALESAAVFVWSAAARKTVQLYAADLCHTEDFRSLPLCGRRARFMPRPRIDPNLGVLTAEEEVRLKLRLELTDAVRPTARLQLLRNAAAAEMELWEDEATPLDDDALAEFLRHVDFRDPLPPRLLSYAFADARAASLDVLDAPPTPSFDELVL